jgi:hypothetical protein
MSRPRLSFTERRRRRMAVKLNLDRLETRWLMHHGEAPWGAILRMERMRAVGVDLADGMIERWVSSHRAALEHVWASHPRWAAAVGLPRIAPDPPPAASSLRTSSPPPAPSTPPPAAPPPPTIYKEGDTGVPYDT